MGMTLDQAKAICWMCNQDTPGGFRSGLSYHTDVSGTSGKVPCLAMPQRSSGLDDPVWPHPAGWDKEDD